MFQFEKWHIKKAETKSKTKKKRKGKNNDNNWRYDSLWLCIKAYWESSYTVGSFGKEREWFKRMK